MSWVPESREASGPLMLDAVAGCLELKCGIGMESPRRGGIFVTPDAAKRNLGYRGRATHNPSGVEKACIMSWVPESLVA